MKHEFMIVPWKGEKDALPYDSKTQQVDENKLKAMQGVEDLLPGQAVTVRFSLSEGRYVAFCNEPGHYRDAMSGVFLVNSAR
ncbi:plastocyanin/azurin family copper-binding protein [Paraburkholderia sediminicola]|uniref:plastocyanin/azurin family copper-binding protein n=1 Tax=Paraburkholderia sediminicola TaxID=458836 RepID=UPI0038BD7990